MSTQVLSSLAAICGWIYFSAWSLSFYPQIILNHQNKKITGLSLDYVVLNLTGFSAYAIFTSLLYWMPQVREQFSLQNAGALPQVEFNDVVFAIHGVITTYFTAVQCLIYPLDARAPRVRNYVNFGSSLGGVIVVVGFFLSYRGCINWMIYVRFCGVLKFLASFTKYVPQVVLNFRRKSTEGFSISQIAFDLVGGIFSVAQQGLSGIEQNTWSPFTKNFAKTGLGFETILFDTILMIQHFFLYADSGKHSDVDQQAELLNVPLLSTPAQKDEL